MTGSTPDGVERQQWQAKPLLASRLQLQQACPYGRALGIELMEWGNGRAITRMAPSPLIALSEQDHRIDPLALVGMLDDAFSNAITTVLPADIGISTLDLRMELARATPPDGTVTAETRVALLDNRTATAHVEAHDSCGLLATGSSMFTLGGYPGGAPPDLDRIGRYDPAVSTGPYRTLVGLEGAPGEETLSKDNLAVVGWETGQALHGGVVGAVLMATCGGRAAAAGELATGKRLGSLYIRYLRPGSATQRLQSRSWVDRQGRSATFISAECFHEEGRSVAQGHAVYVPG